MAVDKISISLMPEVAARIAKRHERGDAGNRSFAIAKQLNRYFDMIDHCKRELRSMLSDKECALILDAFNGTAFMDTVSIRYAWHEIADAIDMDRLDHKWEVDGKALVDKLQSLSFGHLIALVDSTEIWWNRVASGEQLEYGEMLR